MFDFLYGLCVSYYLLTDHGHLAIVMIILWVVQWIVNLVYKFFFDDDLKINMEDFKRYRRRYEIKYYSIKTLDELKFTYATDKVGVVCLEDYAALKDVFTETFNRLNQREGEWNDKKSCNR